MSYTVYLDVVFLINFGMDVIIIWLTGMLCRQSIPWWRYLISPFAGSLLFILVIWLPLPTRWLYYICSYGIIGMFTCYLAYSPKGIKEMLKCYGSQLFITFLLGGTMNWLYFSTPVGGWLNSIFEAQGLQLREFGILVVITSIILVVLTTGFRQYRSEQSRDYYKLSLYFEEANIYGVGLVDTGNFLVEPMTKRPVVIAEAHWLLPILPEDYQQLVIHYLEDGVLDYDWIAKKKLTKARWIPFQSVGESQGELLGIQCRKLILRQKNRCFVHEHVIVGISRTMITGSHQYQMLLHTDLVEQEEQYVAGGK